MENQKLLLESWLTEQQPIFRPLIRGLRHTDLQELDLGPNNQELQSIDLKDTSAFESYLFEQVLRGQVGIGGFFENRSIYRRSAHFGGAEARSLHLGLDIWAPAGTMVHAPLKAIVHSLADNQGFGNYGPTLILEHRQAPLTFYSLYGHMSSSIFGKWEKGNHVVEGETLGEIGNYPENGDWPPHLHWQVMTDMLGKEGDFPGVAEPTKAAYYQQLCINPRLLLRLEA
jgi:murein DD-endopeptidase MepM/ murein hydrolase activator NlpD